MGWQPSEPATSAIRVRLPPHPLFAPAQRQMRVQPLERRKPGGSIREFNKSGARGAEGTDGGQSNLIEALSVAIEQNNFTESPNVVILLKMAEVLKISAAELITRSEAMMHGKRSFERGAQDSPVVQTGRDRG